MHHQLSLRIKGRLGKPFNISKSTNNSSIRFIPFDNCFHFPTEGKLVPSSLKMKIKI